MVVSALFRLKTGQIVVNLAHFGSFESILPLVLSEIICLKHVFSMIGQFSSFLVENCLNFGNCDSS